MSSPPTPSFYLSFFLCPLSLVRPRRRLSPAPTAYSQGRHAQMLSRLAASSAATTLWGASAFTAIEHDGRLDGSGVDYTPVYYLSVSRVSAHYSDNGCCFLAGLATKSMARAIIASTYIRQLRSGLPRCCLHGRSRRRDGTHLSDGRSARCRSAMRTYSHTSDLPDTPDWGCRNSARCRR